MNLDELAAMQADFVPPNEIARRLGCSMEEVINARRTPECLTRLGTLYAKKRRSRKRIRTPQDCGRTMTAREEFDRFLWDHAGDRFQARFDECPPITEDEHRALLAILSPFSEGTSPGAAAKAAKRAVESDMATLCRIVQLVGLTRSKILQDAKSSAKANGIPIHGSSIKSLVGDDNGRRVVVERIAPQLARVFGRANAADNLEALNEATWKSYIRQARAKRSGHNAEHQIALALRDCGLPFEPARKLYEPLCGDVEIDEVSYDIVSPSADNALLRMQCSAHTSNPGKYGDKIILELNKAVKSIGGLKNAGDVTLLSFVDGIGFHLATRILDEVFAKADEFCQFRTMWKAVTIAASKCGKRATVALPREGHAHFAPFCERYGASLLDSATPRDPGEWVRVGDALVQVS